MSRLLQTIEVQGQVCAAMGSAMYANTQAAGGGATGGPTGGAAGAEAGADDVMDAEIVDEDNK